MEHCKWKKHSGATQSGVPDDNKVCAWSLMFLTNSYSGDTSPEHGPCATTPPAARALPLIAGSQCPRDKRSPVGLKQVRGISLQTPASHEPGVPQWLLWTLLCRNIFRKACQPFPHTEETAERGVWDGLMASLETSKVLSDSWFCCYAYHSHCEAGLFLCTLQGNYPAYAFSPPSDWSPESADHRATTQNKNQTVRSHAWASKKLQGKEKERKKAQARHAKSSVNTHFVKTCSSTILTFISTYQKPWMTNIRKKICLCCILSKSMSCKG